MRTNNASGKMSLPPKLAQLITKKEKLVIGLMSGTSADGIDAALVRIFGSSIETHIELVAFEAFPYPSELKQELLDLAGAETFSIDRITELNFLLGDLFAEAAIAVARSADISMADIDLIGSHGQTVRHLPQERRVHGRQVRATWQIAEPSVIAKRAAVITVADFRPADMALDGQGAPLVPLFDYFIFRSSEKSRILLNIGGIANLTVLAANCSLEQVIAFDTGPGNMVIDVLTKKLFGRDLDLDGMISSQGTVSEKLLQSLLQHPYFSAHPPKSTGREIFGAGFIHSLITTGKKLRLSNRDMLATATELTAQAIVGAYHRFVAPECQADEWIVSGGGAMNKTLMASLAKALGNIPIRNSAEFGVPSEAKEAMCFAVLANETICENFGNVPSATSASSATVLGKICM